MALTTIIYRCGHRGRVQAQYLEMEQKLLCPKCERERAQAQEAQQAQQDQDQQQQQAEAYKDASVSTFCLDGEHDYCPGVFLSASGAAVECRCSCHAGPHYEPSEY